MRNVELPKPGAAPAWFTGGGADYEMLYGRICSFVGDIASGGLFSPAKYRRFSRQFYFPQPAVARSQFSSAIYF